MTKWPVQKQTHWTAQQHAEHQHATDIQNKLFFLAHLSTKCSVSFCDPSMSVVRASVRASVNNFFKQHLLWNRLLDFDQTSQEWSLVGPLSKLFKLFQFLSCLLVWKYKAQSFHIWCITSSRGPLPIFGGQH